MSGLLVILPVGLTAYVLWLLVGLVGNVVGPNTHLSRLLTRAFGHYVPGTELLVAVGVVLLVGAFARYWLGKRLLSALENRLIAVPILSKIYWAIRQLSHALLKREVVPDTSKKRLVLLKFPKEGSYAVGVLTNDHMEWLDEVFGKPSVSVYMPTAPDPFCGWVLFLPADSVTPLDLTMDEGLSLVLSAGMVLPERLQVPAGTDEKPHSDPPEVKK